MLYSHGTSVPEPLPDRILLPDGRVRSDPTTYTDEEIAGAGYLPVDPPPKCDIDQQVIWTAGQDGVPGWQVVARDPYAQWVEIRRQRDALMGAFEWRIERWQRNDRLGRFQTDTIASLDAYMQSLADLTLQPDPFRIDWPVPPSPAGKRTTWFPGLTVPPEPTASSST